ncbi:hypothetical protein AMJ57_02155, partial [Parcubacteria bacterium SG8_24]
MTAMNSAAYIGKLAHARTKPRKNAFSYPGYMMYLDLDEIPDLHRKLTLFSMDRFNLFSFHDRDHFKFIDQDDPTAQTIMKENVSFKAERYRGKKTTKERIGLLLRDAGFDFSLGRVMVLTNLRTFGYTFNPVSFYYCYDADGIFRVLLSEVNNTFGDQKMYFTPIRDPKADLHGHRQQKNFYISPFIDHDNILEWSFSEPGDSVMISVDSQEGGESELKATFVGARHELTDGLLFRLNFRYPLFTLMVIGRIYYQALKLFLKKIRFRDKEEE